ncbi:outer membrane transport energization protein ExbD [Alkalispirillum mobile]|uniref:Outer membrane transport energization protein ExbD n=1 Tax=Alkalispirillum mobile TaxID=85925 RepID=A0A498C6K8_9GAMM|nr:biopolymer transporter ExbD [Alkalispirillum mobile]RLK50709.1 outer membrane transport energization protein ExbD [Alkalispirillum mobile]
MKLPQKESRLPEENVIPLINIVFLLLIFFMLAGVFTRPEPFDVTPPISTSPEETDPDELVILLGPDGELALNSDELELAGLPAALSAWEGDLSALTVQIKADGGAGAGALMTVLDDLREAGADRVVLLTRREDT